MAVKQKKNNNSNWFIFAAINLVALPISAYQTYIGYQADMPMFIAIGIAAFTTVMFLGLNLQIAKHRLANQPIKMLVAAYLLPLVFSFLGNFSAFYANFATEDLILRKGNNSIEIVKQNLIKIDERLPLCKNGWDETRAEFLTTRQELIKQAALENGGFADASLRLFNKAYKNITGNLPSNLLRNYRDPMDPAKLTYALEILDDALVNAEDAERKNFVNFDKLEGQLRNGVDSLALIMGSTPVNERAFRDQLDKVRITNDELLEDAKAHFEDEGNCAGTSLPALKPIPEQKNWSGFGWAFESAFEKFEDPINTLISLCLALVLDLGVLLFMILLNKPVNRSKLGQNQF